jgi:hypothetical protein
VHKCEDNIKIVLVHEGGEEQSSRMMKDIAYFGFHNLYFSVYYSDD